MIRGHFSYMSSAGGVTFQNHQDSARRPGVLGGEACMLESQAVGSPCRDTVISHVEWRILRSCLARGFWKQTAAGPSTLFFL